MYSSIFFVDKIVLPSFIFSAEFNFALKFASSKTNCFLKPLKFDANPITYEASAPSKVGRYFFMYNSSDWLLSSMSYSSMFNLIVLKTSDALTFPKCQFVVALLYFPINCGCLPARISCDISLSLLPDAYKPSIIPIASSFSLSILIFWASPSLYPASISD